MLLTVAPVPGGSFELFILLQVQTVQRTRASRSLPHLLDETSDYVRYVFLEYCTPCSCVKSPIWEAPQNILASRQPMVCDWMPQRVSTELEADQQHINIEHWFPLGSPHYQIKFTAYQLFEANLVGHINHLSLNQAKYLLTAFVMVHG